MVSFQKCDTSSQETFGYIKEKYQDWFDSNDPNILPLMVNMHKGYRQWTSDKKNVTNRNEFKKAMPVLTTESETIMVVREGI